MERATARKGIEGRGPRRLLVAACCLALALACVPAATAAKKNSKPVTSFRSGNYLGKTKQETVALGFRSFQFTLNKKGKVTLVTEPVVRKEFCTSTPVFTLDGATPTKPLSSRGAFKFTSTFEGTRIDSVKGQFVSATKVEGFAVYNFQGQSDLCTPGSVKVPFTATRQKQKTTS